MNMGGPLVWALVLALALGACAPKRPPLPEQPPQPAEQTWERFQSRLLGHEDMQGFSIQASVHLISPGRQDRIAFQAWGNFDLPIRLDLKAGLGTTFSMWRVTPEKWLAYYPGQNKAFVHPDSRTGAARLGFSTPFDLRELTFIFCADWRMILPPQYSSSSYDPDFGWRFEFGGQQQIASVSISPDLDVTRLTGTWPSRWTMRFADHAVRSGRRMPGRVMLQSDKDSRAIVHLKDVEFRPAWPEKAVKLQLPDDAEHIFLSQE
jgi:hypothetical protein